MKTNKTKSGEIVAYKCSDGYITESKTIYKRREKVLKKIKEYYSLSDKERENSGMSWWFLSYELKKAERNSEEIKDDEQQRRLFIWRRKNENRCKSCKGSGKYYWTDCSNAQSDHESECDSCEGSGLNEKARKYYYTKEFEKEVLNNRKYK